jgi:hypothetical protein
MRIAWYNVSIGVSATQRKVARYNMVEYRMEVRYKEGVAYVNGWQLNPAYSRFLSGGEIALRMRIIVLRPVFETPEHSDECRVPCACAKSPRFQRLLSHLFAKLSHNGI